MSVEDFKICHVTETPAMLNQRNIFLGEDGAPGEAQCCRHLLLKIFSAMKSLCI